MNKFVLALCLFCSISYAQTFESTLGKIEVGEVKEGIIEVPFLTWGGDIPTFMANGGFTTTPNSVYGQSKLNLKMVNGDNFQQQVKDYLSGKSPYLRSTVHMLGLASEIISKDPRTKPVVFLQLTWSAGDHIVSRANIKKLNDLKGKKICLQQSGPHLGLLDDSLKAANLTWNDITVVYVSELTGPNGPAEKMKQDNSIDAACVISVDMLGLCGGIDQTGTGAEGSIEGSHVLNSTVTMNHSIADVYAVRSDYFKSHRNNVMAFMEGYHKEVEKLLVMKKAYNNGSGKSPEYMKVLKLTQEIYGEAVIPTLENDAHGLISDVTFARIPGNELFFNDPNNLTGFSVKEKESLELASNLGFINSKNGFSKADWNYKEVSNHVGVDYVVPVMTTGRIKAEVSDFAADLDSNTIYSFEIKFEPEEIDFKESDYAKDFQKVCEDSQKFGNAVILIRGHSDPTMTLQNFFWAAKAKGLITGSGNSYKFKGTPLNLADTNFVIQTIQGENLANLTRVDSKNQTVAIDDPRTTVAAALQLSQGRAITVKKRIEEYAKSRMYQIDFSQIQPQGIGISEPVNPRPRNMDQAKENMRVEFRIVRVKTESINEDSFNFDN